CFPWFLRQADLAARAHGASEVVRKALAARVSRVLAGVPGDEIPARVATCLQAVIRDELETDDPFREVKEREFVRFGEMVSRAESSVAASADPMAASVWMAVYGNIMDSGIVDRESMEVAVSRLAAGDGERKIPERLRDAIRDARTIGVLLDNSGEAAFDVPLLSRLSREGRTVWVGVKGGAVIDDLTEAEARRLGLSAYAEIVSNGNRGVGTDLGLCTREFRERIEGSDLVLSKGQANFETLYGNVRNAFFLFRCKCPVVSRALGRSEGDLVLLDGEGA
ncbi:MAG TPA: ARMT1-like domain-containing protein, partial [Candidatus Deferrimicrobiaceae bacterium]|nr:ARMT1-like domain-containing protein [Candidatus Deferrimicrobiaceae bacterium]